MKKQPQAVRKEKRAGRNGAKLDSNGRRDRASSVRGLRHPESELESAIQRYVDLYDFAPIAYVSFDRAGRIEEANLAATELLNEPRDLLIGRPFAFYVRDLDSFLKHLLYCRTWQQQVKTELLLKNRKGEQIAAVLLSAPITSTTKNGAMLYQTAIIDLRERKAQERALAEQARLLDLSTDAIIVRDAEDQVTYWNKGAEKIYGYTREEALGKVVPKLLKTEHLEPLPKIYEKLLRDNRWEGELMHTRRDGTRLAVFSRWALDHDAHGNRAFILETNNDISDLKEAEAALRESKEMLERLVQQRTKALRLANTELRKEISRRKGLEGQILEISDREQERLGQELHDGLCQQLTAIGFLARATALRLKDHRVVQQDDLEKIAQLINRSVMDARNIAHDLHKEEIDAAEFESAIRDLVSRKIWKTPCRLDLKTKINIENDAVASQLYRILREAIINANKHARATEVVLQVRRSKKEFIFSVTDNGVGFNRSRGHGLGFHIMKYRAESIGARLELESLRKRGARVTCYLPIARAK
jgi:PAS domain S-box-containing protein